MFYLDEWMGLVRPAALHSMPEQHVTTQ
jgi:hypothetical protein